MSVKFGKSKIENFSTAQQQRTGLSRFLAD